MSCVLRVRVVRAHLSLSPPPCMCMRGVWCVQVRELFGRYKDTAHMQVDLLEALSPQEGAR